MGFSRRGQNRLRVERWLQSRDGRQWKSLEVRRSVQRQSNNGVTIMRRSAMYVDNQKLGRVTWGLWSEAKDDITKDNVVIKGLDQTMHADFYMNWSFFLRPKGSQFQNAEGLSSVRYLDIGRCYSTPNSAFDCSTQPYLSTNLEKGNCHPWFGWLLDNGTPQQYRAFRDKASEPSRLPRDWD